MKCGISLVLGFLTTLGAGSAAMADDGFWYAEGGYHHANLDSEDGASLTLGLIGGNLGYEFASGWAVEAVLAQGILEDDLTILGIDVPFKAGTWYGLAGKYSWLIGDRGSVSVKLRTTSVGLEADAPGATVSESEWKVGWAIGGAYDLTDSVYAIGEFNQFMDTNTGVFVGVGIRF